MESRAVAASLEGVQSEEPLNGYRLSFWCDGNVLNLIVIVYILRVVAQQLCEHTIKH